MGLGEISPNSQMRNTWAYTLAGFDAKKGLPGRGNVVILEGATLLFFYMANAYWSFAIVPDLCACVWLDHITMALSVYSGIVLALSLDSGTVDACPNLNLYRYYT